MSEEKLKAFLEKVQSDTNLQEKLKAAADANAVVDIAKEAGFSISADDLKNAQSDITELSDEELEGVAGPACLQGVNRMATPSGQGNLFEQPVAANNGLVERSLLLSAELLRSWQERIHQFQAPLFASQLGPAVVSLCGLQRSCSLVP